MDDIFLRRLFEMVKYCKDNHTAEICIKYDNYLYNN